jgi:hypothetical protein
MKRSSVRLRPALLAAVVALGVAALPGAHAAPPPVVTRANPCTLAYDSPAGDVKTYYAGPNDPDVDVTHVTWQVTATTLVVTAEVAALGDGPLAAWGDYFQAEVQDRASKTRVTYGYFRTPSGGGPTFAGGKVRGSGGPGGAYVWTAYPGGPTHLVADFDKAKSQVVLTIPRKDLEVAFGAPFGKLVLTVLGVNTFLMDASYDPVMADYGQATVDVSTTFLPVADCDRWIPKGPRPTPAQPCLVDLVAETGNETSRTSDVVPTRDDSVDVAHVTYRLGRKDLVVTVRVARLTDRALFGTGQGYAAVFMNHGTSVQFGVTRDAVDGTKVRQYGGAAVAPLTVTAAFDAPRGVVTLTIPRVAVAAAFGVKDNRTLVLANPGATAFWTLNGDSAGTADGDANATGKTLSFASCDKTLR